MTTAKNARAIAATAKGKAKAKPAPALFSGRGMAARGTALLETAPLAFATETSRAALVANVAKVLGDKPTPEQVKAVKTQLVIGWTACRLPVSELPKGKTSPADRIAFATDVVTRMARAPQEGVASPALRKGQIARRSPVQERITRNMEKNASLFLGELNLSGAQTQKAKNEKQAKAKKTTTAPAMAGSDKRAKQPDGTNAAVWDGGVGKPAKAMTADDVVAYIAQQSSMLQDFANKHAKVMPTDMGMAVSTFRKAVLAAANAHQERKAKAKAIADAKAAKANA